MHSSSKIIFLNTMISSLALAMSVVLGLLVKLYLDTTLPLLVFFILIFFGFHIIKDLLKVVYRPTILTLQEETLKELTQAFNKLENFIKK